MVKHSAFTIIELLFAIVIIGLTVLSLPMMMQVNMDSSQASIQEEAIFAASAKMMQVLSYPWDEHSINPNQPLSSEKVVNVPLGNAKYSQRDINNTVDSNSSFRIGHVRQDLHRRFHENNTFAFFNVSNLVGNDDFTIIGMEEMAQLNIPLSGLAGSGTYKDNYTMNVAVNYISDADPAANTPFILQTATIANPSNIRMVTVSIRDGNAATIATLRAYATNIGEVDYFKRTY